MHAVIEEAIELMPDFGLVFLWGDAVNAILGVVFELAGLLKKLEDVAVELLLDL